MTDSRFTDYAARLAEFIQDGVARPLPRPVTDSTEIKADPRFDAFALELFALQFETNSPYRTFCLNRSLSPATVRDWREIPAIPAVAFKELDLTSLPPAERSTVFHSSGTTEQQPSRHYHNGHSLEVYEASLLAWFQMHWGDDADGQPDRPSGLTLLFLTPPPTSAPHSSLVHMFDTIRRVGESQNPLGMEAAHSEHAEAVFLGIADGAGAWELDWPNLRSRLQRSVQRRQPVGILGTAFNFVHLLDHLAAEELRFELPRGSRLLETGGYKGRSRALSKAELHACLAQELGVPPSHILSEYGMSELSSQAYDGVMGQENRERTFQFPPWARAQIISPETGREAPEGETGIIHVLDLANLRSVAAIQTEDLGVRHNHGFLLHGRAASSEPRGCSRMAI